MQIMDSESCADTDRRLLRSFWSSKLCLLDVAHNRIRFGPAALDHDLRQARTLQQQVLRAANAQRVSADRFDGGFTQSGTACQSFVDP